MTRPRKYIPPRRVLYALIVALVTAISVASISVYYANYVDRKSNQRWCGMVVALDNTYREKPPNSDLGRDLANEFRKLRHDFDCNN